MKNEGPKFSFANLVIERADCCEERPSSVVSERRKDRERGLIKEKDEKSVTNL